ncbi:hypothetical protein CC80DRAFT_16893 [Byssothecium circinans]|uniref:Uncharacterized protein n=1 Tax=Byssothecium circinans TaxID=147558 RepID=A0A6A5U0J4_9PLEO|nr:hypothetical protein CC80DRAFT_16893 [Byssothecium circinans]
MCRCLQPERTVALLSTFPPGLCSSSSRRKSQVRSWSQLGNQVAECGAACDWSERDDTTVRGVDEEGEGSPGPFGMYNAE